MGDFVIVDGVLTEYKGNDEHVFIPENVVKIAKGAFGRKRSDGR